MYPNIIIVTIDIITLKIILNIPKTLPFLAKLALVELRPKLEKIIAGIVKQKAQKHHIGIKLKTKAVIPKPKPIKEKTLPFTSWLLFTLLTLFICFPQ